MNKINVEETKWSSMPDIHGVIEFSEEDTDCLKEIRDVLKKHNVMDRFGITLLHTHFDIAEDEMLLETTDVEQRTQLIRPVKKNDFLNNHDVDIMTTSLKFVDGNMVVMQNCGCLRHQGNHTGQHNPYA